MDLLRIILNSENFKITCFMCYKQSKTILNIHDKVEIHSEFFNISLALVTVVTKVFPLYDFSVEQLCNNCTSLFIEMYVTLKKHDIKKALFNGIINRLNEEVKIGHGQDNKKCAVRINLADCKEIVNIQNGKCAMMHEVNFVNKEPFIKCNTCCMTFHSKEQFRKHNNISHKNANDAVVCEVCGKVFSSSNSLKSHLNCHTEIECPHCFKILKSHSYYNIHLKNHESGIKRSRTKKYYHCNDCDYKSLNKGTLQAHMNKTHLNIRPHTCQICLKSFYRKSNLTEHVNTHSKTSKAVCELCGDNFLNKKSLIEHLRLHSDIRPYECEICNKKFVTSGRRQTHIKKTHGEKNEQCQMCGTRFSLKKDLVRHMKKHLSVNN